MHDNDIYIDTHLVRRLVEKQFPQWSDLPIEPVDSAGTDNVIYRLGENMVVRLPRIASAAAQVDKEHQWLLKLAPHLTINIPVPLGKGMPNEKFPWSWVVYQWLEGNDAIVEPITDLKQTAVQLAHFITALQKIDPSNSPISQRGHPLAVNDQETRAALNSLHGIINVDAATRAWEVALNAPELKGPPVWIHGDLHPGNLLVKQGRLSAIIDFGITGIGDPACDMMVAWTLLSAKTRNIFRASVQVDDATWARGRGWALTFGLVALPYYQKTNPVLADIARRTINEVLADKDP